MASVFDVANYFLSKKPMSPKKLQKIVYYAYAWGITLFNDSIDDLSIKIFDDDKAEAWVHGPVFPRLYYKYKSYGAQDIKEHEPVPKGTFSSDELDVLDQVMDVYGGDSANELELFTHQESPWRVARGDCKPFDICTNQISDEEIYRCYSKRIVQ